MATVEELLEKAERFAGQQRWEEAALVARQAVDTVPEHRWAKDKLGWYLSRAKKHADAIEVYSLLVQEAPENPKYPYMLGYQYYDQQDFTNAVPWFRKALDLKPDYLVVLYRCGCHLAEGFVFTQDLAHHFRFEFRAVGVSHSASHPLIIALFYCPIYGVHHNLLEPPAEQIPCV